MNMGPILGLDGMDGVDTVDGAWPAVLTAEEWASLMAPVDVTLLEDAGRGALALAVEADETAGVGWHRISSKHSATAGGGEVPGKTET